MTSSSHQTPRTAIITGGATGLGYAVAEQFLRQGDNVVLNGRTESKLQHAAEQLGHPDRVATVFVPTVMLLALAVFSWWTWHGDAQVGLFRALSVLLISCPCALGIAAPLAKIGRAHV